MALQALWAPETQFQNKNGSLLVQGKIYVQYRGRSQLAKTYRDADGTYLNTNPLLTDNDGRVLCFADDAFSYTAVVCDFYGNELFSFDPIPCGSGSGSGSSSGSSAQHWIGINGQTQQVSRNTYTRLKLPSGLDNVDYEGDFVLGTIKGSGTEMVLKEGLYLVNTVIRFKQSSDDLTNTLSNVIVHTRDFDTPNIQEVGAVVRDEAGPDASDDIHTITLTYIRHVSQDDVGSDRIKFAVETPNTWTECYIQNLQIAKLGSSVGGGGSASLYEPGQYISIENDTISVTGIDPDSYATHDELQSATSAFITSADLPDLSSYATEQWVLDKHYITSADIPDIPDDLVTSAELAQTSGLIEQDIADLTSAISESLAEKMDKSSSADFYPRYDNPEGYLTSIPSEYVTESEMSGYVQDHTSGFITSADLPDISDMATQTWVTEQHYITSADVPPQIEYSAGDNIDITDHVVSVTDTSLLLAGDNVSITPSGDNYVISAQLPATSGYVTEQEMNDAIQSATSSFITSADLPDVSDMATQTWVGEQGYLTSIPSEYITESELESELSGKADTSAIPDVSNFVTQEDIDASVSGKMDATESSAFYPMATNPSGYLVSSDLNGYATESYVQDQTSAFVDSDYVTDYVASQTSGKQDKLTFEYNEESAISAINGSALAGGSSFDPSVLEDYIPYSAAGVDLPNSNFSIDTSGQAYKKIAQDQALDVTITNGYITFNSPVSIGDIIEVRTTVSNADHLDYLPTLTQEAPFVNGVARFKVEYAMSGLTIQVLAANYAVVTSINSSNTQVVTPGESAKYALESYVDSAVSGKQDTLTFGYDESDKINAINGSAIAGGGGGGGSYTAGEFIDITNDVISVNSGDVSNLIPGSGILITQSSAGTMVSIDPEELPKSTPYETTLWEGENGELISANNYSVNLSDDPLSYSRIGVYGRPNENAGCQNYIEFDPSYSAVCKTVTPYYNSTTLVMDINTYSFSGTNKMTLLSQTHVAGTTSYAGGLWIYKVVGINKKES